mmetsp:Transcript_114763/g.199613  ORF Transcript_114763/g.199613 Transcript_114763/m.199613 type:complete len:225 (-) Transcript_114763:827-1501(-)
MTDVGTRNLTEHSLNCSLGILGIGCSEGLWGQRLAIPDLCTTPSTTRTSPHKRHGATTVAMFTALTVPATNLTLAHPGPPPSYLILSLVLYTSVAHEHHEPRSVCQCVGMVCESSRVCGSRRTCSRRNAVQESKPCCAVCPMILHMGVDMGGPRYLCQLAIWLSTVQAVIVSGTTGLLLAVGLVCTVSDARRGLIVLPVFCTLLILAFGGGLNEPKLFEECQER